MCGYGKALGSAAGSSVTLACALGVCDVDAFRRSHVRCVVAVLLVCLGCSEATTPSSTTHLVPAEVRWVEWPFQLSTVVGESLRAVVYVPCRYPHINVSVARDSILITADDESNIDGSCLGISNGMYDTIVPMPDLHPEEPPELFKAVPYFIVVRTRNDPTPGLVPVILGPLELTFRPPFQPIRRVGGIIRLDRDGAGCSWATPLGLLSAPYLIFNAPQLDSAGYPYEALVGGNIATPDSAICGRTYGILLSFARVNVK